jgi:hypothetical protein
MQQSIAAMMDGLYASELAETVTYQAANGSSVFDIPALVRQPDVVGDFGAVSISQDARTFEIHTAHLATLLTEPKRGDLIMLGEFPDQTIYRVQSDPLRDQLGISWLIDAYIEHGA